MQPARPARVRLMGVELDPITPVEMLAATAAFIARGGTAVIANHNSHSLYLHQRSERLRAFFAQADLVQIDSRPLIAWGARLGLPLRPDHRSTYLDWRGAFWDAAAANGWRVFYIGGAPGVAEAARRKLIAERPSARIAVHEGYFDADGPANGALLQAIAAFDPDVVMVGMGMPRQELWILDNRPALKRGVLFPVGAAFDYEAGVQRAAPRALGALGLEWLFRLAASPRRLAFRYLVEPWFLLPAAIGDLRAARGRRAGR
jgi:N-acetylglucosaminyldiphosphoundecaprenol N-acetyl-beta-D-mannosaminyltransferase